MIDRLPPAFFDDLAARFNRPEVEAIALMGSHARGEARPFSDIDLHRYIHELLEDLPGSGSHLIEDRLVVVFDARPSERASWFARPEKAVNLIPALRQLVPLFDPQGAAAAVRERAQAFVWNEAMQQAANVYASREMVGWIEEAHKGLEGLRRNDIGRLLNATFGLSWGLARVMQTQRGLLAAGDNAFLNAIEHALGWGSEWVSLCRASFGYGVDADLPLSLRQRAIAGLRLYILTARLLADAWTPEDRPLIEQTARRIEAELARLG
jgi:hypothetical protein